MNTILSKQNTPVRQANSTPSFRDYADSYISHYRTRNGYGPKAAPATMRRKAACVRQLQNYFGDTRLSDITPADIAECIDSLSSHGLVMARADAAELKTMFHRASMRTGDAQPLLLFNPAKDVPLPMEPRSRQAQKKPITPSQEQALYKWFLIHRSRWAVLIPLGCNVDLRPQDYLALKVGDIDPSGPLINIVRSQSFITGKGLITKDPKTPASAQPRYISPGLMKIVEQHIAEHTDGKPESWLVTGPRGGMLDESLFYKWFKDAGTAIGRPDLTPYVMRATADDRLSRGHFGNMKEMLALQGRSDAATSIRHYQKLDDVSMKEQVDEIWERTHPTIQATSNRSASVALPHSSSPRLKEELHKLLDDLDETIQILKRLYVME